MSVHPTTAPTVTGYVKGTSLVTTGMSLTAVMTDGTTKTVTSGFTCSPTTLTVNGTRTITVTYGNATAADLYELAGIHDFKYEMTRIGWTSVDGAEIVQTDDGYIITLPQPKPITYKEEP